MRRYIDTDLLKDKTTRVNNIWNVITNAEGKGLDEIIDDIPTADVRENVRGEWKMTITAYPYCSNCRWMPEEDEMTHGFYDFCPNCGAEMRGEQS